MSTFSYSPAYSVNKTVQPKTRKAVFGDGYQQRVADGINTQKRLWSLTFIGNYTRIGAIDDFLTTANGVDSFDWTPPDGAAGKFICESWVRTKNNYGVDDLTATFEEVFGE